MLKEQRARSVTSLANQSGNQHEDGAKANQAVDAEEMASGVVSSKVYIKYLLNGGNILFCFVLLFLNVLFQALCNFTDWFLSYW